MPGEDRLFAESKDASKQMLTLAKKNGVRGISPAQGINNSAKVDPNMIGKMIEFLQGTGLSSLLKLTLSELLLPI